MKDIYKDKFIIFLVFLPVIAMTGWFSAFVWAAFQLCTATQANNNDNDRVRKLKQEDYIISLNKPENLTKANKEFLASHPGYFRTGYDRYEKDPDWKGN